MSAAEQVSHPLVGGERLSREEFLRRWEALPELKFAELLEGVVYLPSPLSLLHGTHDFAVANWLGDYAQATPGCEGGLSTTWLMLEDAPQPDCFLRILPEYGGQSGEERRLAKGAPELIVEIAVSSSARDLGPKLRLYRTGGVREYITVLVEESRVVWRRLVAGEWLILEPGADGVLRSVVFPGLWLDPAALLGRDLPRVAEVLKQGLESADHRRFLITLAKQK